MNGPEMLKLHGSKSRLLCKMFEYYMSQGIQWVLNSCGPHGDRYCCAAE